MGRQVNLNRDL